MLLDWLHGDLHHWAIFCCAIATLGLVGAFWAALAARGGKGIFRFLERDQQPTVIVVNGGRYVPPPTPRRWTFGNFYLLFAAIFSGGPMLTLLIMGANHAAWYAVDWVEVNWWVLLVLPVAALLVIVFWWLIRHDRQREAEQWSELRALPAVVESPDVVPIWTAPVVEGNWAERM